MESKFINPFTDYGFKLIFGREVSKPILLHFLNCLLEGERHITNLTFLDKEQVRLNNESRTLIYDVYCRTDDGEDFIVEMQNRSHPNFRERTLFYAAESISRQGEKGEEWQYNVKAVYCIAFMNFTLPDESKFRIDVGLVDLDSEKKKGERLPLFTDKLRLIYLQLPLFAKKDWSECTTDFDRFILAITQIDILNRMPETARNSVFARLAEIAEVASLTGEERQKYDRSLKQYRDYQMFITQAHSEGKEEGRIEGKEEGRIEGKEEGLIEGEAKGINKRNAYFVGQLKANGLSVEEISKLIGMSPDEVSKYYYD
ncbi:MAG: Rpn family recombination-promoting nuclease/putative transposase [Bacteroidales bacterium]|nr:Rpn family recombination-promoting nuclease/putative transposase [Bacteroidales bacterium]